MSAEDDARWMGEALALAGRAPWAFPAANPAVGCVIVQDGRVVGRGATARVDGRTPRRWRCATPARRPRGPPPT